jgi:hypothetical protein
VVEVDPPVLTVELVPSVDVVASVAVLFDIVLVKPRTSRDDAMQIPRNTLLFFMIFFFNFYE